jgi:aerobic carbon-monoxide dehydrogenase small subunit
VRSANSETEDMANTKTHVVTTINSEQSEFLCEPRQTLLEVLRDVLDMTGTKEGCGDGNCGACTVMMDGRLVLSCLTLGVEAAGAQITTIEGIAEGHDLHPIQQCFLEDAALLHCRDEGIAGQESGPE